jgi:hypothetical protein
LPAAERSGDALAHLIREQRVTHVLLPPVGGGRFTPEANAVGYFIEGLFYPAEAFVHIIQRRL